MDSMIIVQLLLYRRILPKPSTLSKVNIVQCSLSRVNVQQSVFLRMTIVDDIARRFNNPTESYLQSQIKMTSGQSVLPTTVVLRPTLTQTITADSLQRLLGSNHLLFFNSTSIIETKKKGTRVLVIILSSKSKVAQLSRTNNVCRTFRFFFLKGKFLTPLHSDSLYLQYDNHGRFYGEIS